MHLDVPISRGGCLLLGFMIGDRVGIVSEADSDVAEDVVLGREEVLPDVVENVGRIGDNITI